MQENKEKIEYYALRPNLKQFFGRKVNKKLKFDEYTEDKKVRQTLKDLVLKTEIFDKRKTKILVNGVEKEIETIEKSTLTQKLVPGVILIWDEVQGYIIPQYQMATLDEIEEDLKSMQSVYKEK